MEFDRQQFAAALESIQSHSATLDRLGVSQSEIQEWNFSLKIFETLPSTNQTLWDLINQVAPPGTVVIALQQQAGKGQWGRQWHSPPGGLYLSLALAPNLPAHQGAQLTMSSAWGIATALRQNGIPVGLKWPNDLVLSGRKLGGILTETRVQQEKITKAVVGVGINWVNFVPETGINLQSFLASRCESLISLEMLAAVTLVGLASGYVYWQREGINNLLPSYQNLLTSMGRSVEIDGRQGVVVGVGENGNLRVRLHPKGDAPSSEIAIAPGTISLGYG